MVKGADASSIVTSAEMRNLGLSFVVRYFSQYPGKNLTHGEVVDLSTNGFNIVNVYEDDITDWKRGYAGGVNNAQRFMAQYAGVGGPSGRPCYFAVDENIDPNETLLHDYFRGARDTLGVSRTGAYGSTAVNAELKSAGLIGLTWRSMSTAWRGGAGNESDFTIVQTGWISNKFDSDTAIAADYGQWRLGWTPGSVHPAPIVHLWIVDMCAQVDPHKNGTTNSDNIQPIQRALVAESLLARGYDNGRFDDTTRSAYAGWQRRCGYSGRDADGIPGMKTLAKLGALHGFAVVA